MPAERTAVSHRILLLEDNPDDAQLLQIELESAGLSVDLLRTTNGHDFRAALASFAPDLVISDSNLPGFSGQEALDMLREVAPGIPFVYLSGYTPEQLQESAHMQRADGVLSKDRMNAVPDLIRHLLR